MSNRNWLSAANLRWATFVLLTIAASTAEKARADLFNATIVQETTLIFLAFVDYQGPLAGDTIRFQPPPGQDVISRFWQFTITQTNSDGLPGTANDIDVFGRHLVPPSLGAGHGEGQGPLLAIDEFSFAFDGFHTNPGSTNPNIHSDVEIHTRAGQVPTPHRDFLQVRIDALDNNTSRISIRADHWSLTADPPKVPLLRVPEPSSLLLLVWALLVLARRAM